MAANLRALGNYLVVMQGEKAAERKGILLPETAREASNKAEVVAAGPNVQNIKVGDTVLIPLMTLARLAHTQVCDFMIDDKPALVLDANDVAVVWPSNTDEE